MANLKNINFMSEERFKSLTETSEDELYAVEMGSLGIKTGTVITFAANSSLEGYLICNGAAVSRTTYAELFSVIGTTYGSGDGSTTFNVPNLTDKFIQGSGTAGTVKAAGLPNFSGWIGGEQGNLGDGMGLFRASDGNLVKLTNEYPKAPKESDTGWAGSSANKAYGRAVINGKYSNSIYGNSSTVQPPALTMRYYIKY